MGIGPAVAIPAAVKSAGLEINDIDLFEINEAFSSQFVYCCKKLKLDPEKVNVNGGAMALGHPLGATGARCVATLLHEMNRRGKDCRYGGSVIVQMSVCWPLLAMHTDLTFVWNIVFSLWHNQNVVSDTMAGSGMGAAAVLERGDCVDDLRNARRIHSQNFLSKDTL
ncbi:3-ketoacyl-CoA thiolase 2, peroxisomal [Asimina triloba]